MSHLSFWRSSHCTKWIFEQKDVDEKERLLAQKWSLSGEQYDRLFSYLTKFIFLVCSDCGYDYHIAGIAAILFRRVFQAHPSLPELKDLNDDPRLIAVSCIFITAKSKDCNITSINAFIGKIRQSHDALFFYGQDALIQSELLCLKILCFDLNIFLPFEASSDLLMKCDQLDILQHVWKVLLITFKSNIYLLFPPYVVAMGAIYIVCNQEHLNLDFEIFLKEFQIPFENVTEVTKYIVAHSFAQQSHADGDAKQEQSNDKNRKKQTCPVPISVLKQIDLCYAKHKPQRT